MRKPTKKREAAVKAVKDMKNVNYGRDTKPSKSGYCYETYTFYSESWDVSPSSLLNNPTNNQLDKLLGLDTVDGINQYYKQ